jgi:hypothetical protein
METNSLTDEYARTLAALTGTDFQVEVCTRLRSVILGFQDVPAKPQGDAGLDGVSHGGERGYCCYGPEHDEFKTNKGRESGIIKKFSSDLRRLFELDIKNRRLVRKENRELSTILPPGQRIKYIRLIVNWFESHRILGPILAKVAEYKIASACRYVDPDVIVVVTGPKQLAADYAVDEFTIARARQSTFVEKIQKNADTLTIEDPKDFDWKMSVLLEIRPDQPEAVKAVAEGFRNDWRAALAFERELGDTLPTLHLALEVARSQIATRVAALMLSSNEPWTQLASASDLARAILERDFERLYGILVPTVASGEVARLIGECTVRWQKPKAIHG